MKIYIAGKITGLPLADAYSKFETAEIMLQAIGYKTINPMKLPHNHDKEWASYMKECITALVTCEAIFLLPCWQLSEGARIEAALALKMKLVIYELENLRQCKNF